MSFHLMKRTKDDGNDFNKQNELHIDLVVLKTKCPEQVAKESQAFYSQGPLV